MQIWSTIVYHEDVYDLQVELSGGRARHRMASLEDSGNRHGGLLPSNLYWALCYWGSISEHAFGTCS